jgi:hypothetical protein
MNLREEIERRLASNQVYYAHFVDDKTMPKIREETTNDILKLVEKRVDGLYHETKDLDIDVWKALDMVKELLK